MSLSTTPSLPAAAGSTSTSKASQQQQQQQEQQQQLRRNSQAGNGSGATGITTGMTTTVEASSSPGTQQPQASSGVGSNAIVAGSGTGAAGVTNTFLEPRSRAISATMLSTTAAGTTVRVAPISASDPMRPARPPAVRQRKKVKELNEALACFLCRGYLVNATTIDYCVHSFCRSCIIKHLQSDKHCPQCRPGSKQISLSNLRPDEQLKSLVYKLVPGLCQTENERQMQFLGETTAGRCEDVDETVISDQDDDYFSPVEPISLSLEYHPQSLVGCDKQQIPPVRYLQCPAAVTVHHLKRFISSKFDIDLDNQRVDIEIIYEDEILPEDFSLMDVGYCYNWKRLAPMRFFYRILVHSSCNNSNQVVPSDSVLSETDDIIEAKQSKKSSSQSGSESHKTVRFKDIDSMETKSTEKSTAAAPTPKQMPNGSNTSSHSSNTLSGEVIEEAKIKYTVFKSKATKTETRQNPTGFNNNINLNNNNNSNANNNNSGTNGSTINNNNSIGVSKEKLESSSTAVDSRSEMNGGKGPVKMTIIARKSSEMKVKQDTGKTKSHVTKAASPPTPAVSTISPTVVISDFKSLRSNDMRFMSNYSENSSSGSSTASTPTSAHAKHKSSSSKSKSPSSGKGSGKAPQKCDIVVSIPHSSHRSSNSSDDSFENLSLAQLKTASKKVSGGILKQSISLDESALPKEKLRVEKMNLPKLKIELPSLKTRITVPKKIADSPPESKKSPKIRKFSSDEMTSSFITPQVDLTTYAKHIGLKPISPEDRPAASPKSASSSSSSTSPPSATGIAFAFTPEVSSSTSSSHKKRKKGKHSKEPREPGTKRRKLHAEISSQPADESLKLKVKITANHKSHKVERKVSTSSDEVIITSPPPMPTNKPSVIPQLTPATATISNSNNDVIITSPGGVVPQPKIELRNPEKTARPKAVLNIPNLNRTLSEESSNINNLIKEVTPITTIHTTLPHQTPNAKPKQTLTVTTAAITNRPMPATTLSPTSTLSLSSLAGQQGKPPMSPKLLSMQDTKLPVSPPLPPSLFKTAPLTLQTTNSIPPTIASKPTIPTVANQPRLALSNDLRNMAMTQLNRLTKTTPVRGNSNFIVPNPPRILPNSPKLSPISSIASAANRQAAQLKRSVSLDTSPPTLAKQQKLEQDRLIRKSAYAPFITPATSTTGSNSKAASSVGPKSPPPVMISSSNSNNVKPQEMPYYTSAMGAAYTHEIVTRKPMPMLLPPSSISVTKMPDIKAAVSQASLVIPQQQSKKPAVEIVRISSHIPPIDQQKVAVTTSTKPNPPKTTRPPPPPIPLVKIKRTLSHPNPMKPILTTVRTPIQQTTTQQMITSTVSPAPVKSPVTNTPTPPTTPPSTPVPAKPASPKNAAGMTKKVESSEKKDPNIVCDLTGPLDLSGKSSRSPSLEKTTPPGTPPKTPTTPPTSATTTSTAAPTSTSQISESSTTPLASMKTTNASTLEIALNKLKQQTLSAMGGAFSALLPQVAAFATSTSSPLTATNGSTSGIGQVPSLSQKTAADAKSNDSANLAAEKTTKLGTASLPTMTATNSQQISDTTAKNSAGNSSSENKTAAKSITGGNSSTVVSPSASTDVSVFANSGLQNLKLLSDSATNREKITIKNQRQMPMLSKLNDVNKLRLSPAVRQQNASVRNIPNPSALAFRSQPPLPMLASITKTPSPTKATSVSSTTNGTNVPVTTATSVSTPSVKPQVTLPKLQEVSPVVRKLEVNPKTSSPPLTSGSAVTTTTTSATLDAQKLIASKKNLHLEQLAANLNMRAAAAAGGDLATKLSGPPLSIAQKLPTTSAASAKPAATSVTASPTTATTTTTVSSSATQETKSISSSSSSENCSTAVTSYPSAVTLASSTTSTSAIASATTA